MTDNEIFKTEIKCIKRRASGQCNGGTDCCDCDLLMNDKDIISAYERAIKSNEIINRQKAEIEKLQEVVFKQEDTMQIIAKEKQQYFDELQTAKTEAIKEYEKKLLDELDFCAYDADEMAVIIKDIAKKMVGES